MQIPSTTYHSGWMMSKDMQVGYSMCYDFITIPGKLALWKCGYVRSSLIAGLDCGLDRWTGLLDWITGLTFELKLCASTQSDVLNWVTCLMVSG